MEIDIPVKIYDNYFLRNPGRSARAWLGLPFAGPYRPDSGLFHGVLNLAVGIERVWKDFLRAPPMPVGAGQAFLNTSSLVGGTINTKR